MIQGIYSIHKAKMEQILENGIPNETANVIIRLYTTTKTIVRSPDGDTNSFDIVAVLYRENNRQQHLYTKILVEIYETVE